MFILGPIGLWPSILKLGHMEIPLVLFDILIHHPPCPAPYRSVIHFSSMLLHLAPQSTHRDLFLRHRQMGSSLESYSKLEEGDCSFQERESFGSMEIYSCFKPLFLKAPSFPLRYLITMLKDSECVGSWFPWEITVF